MEYGKKTVILLIVLAVLLRALPLFLYGTFFDENSMTAVLAVKQAIPYSHPVPDYLSGLPVLYAEQGIVWLALITYELFGKYIGLFATLYGLKILFTAIAGLVVYKFADMLSDKKGGVLALGVYAVSQVGIYNEAINLLKGESFSVIALMIALLALVCLADAYVLKRARSLWFFALLVLFFASLAFSIFVWNGGYYAIAAVVAVWLSILIWKALSKRDVALVTIAAVVLLPAMILLFSPLISSLQTLGLAPSPSDFAQNLASMLSQTQINLFQSQSLWVDTPFYYIQLALGGIVYFLCALYAITLYIPNKQNNKQSIAFVALYAVLLLGVPFALAQQDWDVLIYIPASIFAGLGAKLILEKRDTRISVVYFAVLITYLILGIAQLTPNTYTKVLPAINNPYLEVVAWMANNTASNAIFVTYPSYGTPIEYYANRESIFDTNIAYSRAIQQDFLYFLALPEGNFSYLSLLRPTPNYLIINTTWAISSPYYVTYASNIDLLESAPYAVISNNISLTRVYDKHGFLIYNIGYGVASRADQGVMVVCASGPCKS